MVIKEKLIGKIFSKILNKNLILTLCWKKNGSYRINVRSDDYERGFDFTSSQNTLFSKCEELDKNVPKEQAVFKFENFEIWTVIIKKRKRAKIWIAVYDLKDLYSFNLCRDCKNFWIKLA